MRGQHRIVGVAAPIGAGHLHQLEGVADLAGRGHVRPAAQVEPVALEVDLDRLVAGDGVDQLDLEGLALVAEHLLGLFAIPNLFGEGLVAPDDLAHLLLDRGKIFRGERLVAEEVVIEAVLDHRADRRPGCPATATARLRPAHARQSCRISSSARGSSRLISSIFASASIGSLRSASVPSSAIATVRLASEGEMPWAISRPVVPLENSRFAPSGKVRAIFCARVLLASGWRGYTGIRTRIWAYRTWWSPAAHSCERAQVSGKQRYSRGSGRLQSGNIKKIGPSWPHRNGSLARFWRAPHATEPLRPRRSSSNLEDDFSAACDPPISCLSVSCSSSRCYRLRVHCARKKRRSRRSGSRRGADDLSRQGAGRMPCGAGCDRWIAIEGEIDRESAGRIRRFLAGVKDTQRPIFLHSPGGNVEQSYAIARLLPYLQGGRPHRPHDRAGLQRGEAGRRRLHEDQECGAARSRPNSRPAARCAIRPAAICSWARPTARWRPMLVIAVHNSRLTLVIHGHPPPQLVADYRRRRAGERRSRSRRVHRGDGDQAASWKISSGR